jgi:hypothetical protein
VWDAAHLLAERSRRWWDRIDGIAYRARTTPSSTSNIAIWSTDGCTATARLLRAGTAELDDLVLRRDVTLDFDWG